MSSSVRGIAGGGFGKSDRFRSRSKTAETPGPHYTYKSFVGDKIQGPVYAKLDKPSESVIEASKRPPHPNKDRTAWMIGTTKHDMAYMSAISSQMGPAAYSPDIRVIKHTYPRNKFGQNPRFQSLTKQYLNKELNTINFCTASPGPKYLSKVSNTDLDTRKPAAYSFGSKGDNVSDRGSFLTSTIKGGFLYRAKPATSCTVNGVGPSNYTPNIATINQTAPRPQWGKADRFKPVAKIYVSSKHSRSKVGQNSPGPCYFPTNSNLGKVKIGVSVAGKWCP